jgi:hypothetical protein
MPDQAITMNLDKAVGETLWSPAAKPVRAVPQPGRNDPCFCGSGKKFKKCCLGKGEQPTNSKDGEETVGGKIGER